MGDAVARTVQPPVSPRWDRFFCGLLSSAATADYFLLGRAYRRGPIRSLKIKGENACRRFQSATTEAIVLTQVRGSDESSLAKTLSANVPFKFLHSLANWRVGSASSTRTAFSARSHLEFGLAGSAALASMIAWHPFQLAAGPMAGRARSRNGCQKPRPPYCVGYPGSSFACQIIKSKKPQAFSLCGSPGFQNSVFIECTPTR